MPEKVGANAGAVQDDVVERSDGGGKNNRWGGTISYRVEDTWRCI